MPRYFLNLRLRGEFIPDEEGIEFMSAEAARSNAILSTRQMIAHDLMEGLPLSKALNGMIEVKDSVGRPVLFMEFLEAAEGPIDPDNVYLLSNANLAPLIN